MAWPSPKKGSANSPPPGFDPPALSTLKKVMRRSAVLIAFTTFLLGITACGYHTVGSAAHLPPGTKTLAVPVFATRTNSNRTEVEMTTAVIREFATRTRLIVTPNDNSDADATLHGTILSQIVAPLNYNSQTQQSSSYLITLVAAVTLKARDGRVLYQNNNYVFRQEYQATTDLATFLDESPAAVQRLSRDFARALVPAVLDFHRSLSPRAGILKPMNSGHIAEGHSR
jgi:outer membrane lipopolysaccharide assembly protein LptE/RlpB